MAAVHRVPTLALLLFFVAASGTPGLAQDEPPPPPPPSEGPSWFDPGFDVDALEARLAALEGESRGVAALDGTLGQARRALRYVTELEFEGRRQAAERARRIARAALILADRQLALVDEREALMLAERRLGRSTAHAESARRARLRAAAQLAEIAAPPAESQ